MGQIRWQPAILAVSLALGAQVPALARNVQVTLTWADEGQADGERPATLVFQPHGGAKGGEASKPLSVTATLPGSLEVELQDDTTYQVEISGPGLWAEGTTFEPARGLPLALEVRPGGRLQAPLVLPRGDSPLSTLALRLKSFPSSTKEGTFEVNFSCPVVQSLLDCAVPAGRFDLRLRSELHAPVYRWDLPIRRGRTERLAAIQLQRGASVSGWVSIHDGKPPAPQCRIELIPETAAPQGGPAPDPRLESLRLSVHPNARGFFQVQGVRAGRYRVSAAQPGLAPASVGPIDVRAGLESQLLEPLRLAPPVQFRVLVEPPADAFGVPWTIRLERRTQPSEAPKEMWSGKVDAQGTWKTPALTPDTYQVSIVDGESSIWKSEFVEVAFGEPDLPLQVELIEIAGRVLLGRDPLSAEIRLSREGRILKFHSDEEGRFSGFLPEAGTWGVDVRSPEEGLALALDEPLEIWVPKGKRRASV